MYRIHKVARQKTDSSYRTEIETKAIVVLIVAQNCRNCLIFFYFNCELGLAIREVIIKSMWLSCFLTFFMKIYRFYFYFILACPWAAIRMPMVTINMAVLSDSFNVFLYLIGFCVLQLRNPIIFMSSVHSTCI